MKITKETLRQLIREELKRRVLKEEDEDDRWRDYFKDKHKKDYISKQYKDKTGKDAPSDPADFGREIQKHYDEDDWDDLSSDAETHSNNKKREAKIKNYNTELPDREFYRNRYSAATGDSDPDTEKVSKWMDSLRDYEVDDLEKEREDYEGKNFVSRDDIGTGEIQFGDKKKSKTSSSNRFRRSKDNNPSMPTPKKKEPSLADPLPDRTSSGEEIPAALANKEITYKSKTGDRTILFKTARSYCSKYGESHPACQATQKEMDDYKNKNTGAGGNQPAAEPQKLGAAAFKSSAEKRSVSETISLKSLLIKDMKSTHLITKKKSLNEAEEIDFNKLDPQRKKQVMTFEKILGGQNDVIFQGIHGYIVNIKASGIGGKYRFSDVIMKKLLAAKARWVEGADGVISVGF